MGTLIIGDDIGCNNSRIDGYERTEIIGSTIASGVSVGAHDSVYYLGDMQVGEFTGALYEIGGVAIVALNWPWGIEVVGTYKIH